MELKIISDGTSLGTKIINIETGEILNYVQKVNIEIDCNTQLATAMVQLTKIPVEINVKNVEIKQD